MTNVTYKEAMEKSPVVLTLTLNNSQPIALGSFVKAFTSLASEYQESIKKSEDFVADGSEIFISQIRSGSIIAELVPYAASVLPLVVSEADKIFVAVDFVKKWDSRIRTIASGVIPSDASKSDLKRVMDAAENIARDPNAISTLEAVTFEDGKREVRASLTFNSNEARVIRDVIDAEFVRLDDKKGIDYERVLLVFTRSDVGNATVGKPSGERVVIEEISEKPLAITYGSELAEQRIKHEIRDGEENIYKKGFNVDVKVQSRGGKPVAYSIMNVHGIVELPD